VSFAPRVKPELAGTEESGVKRLLLPLLVCGALLSGGAMLAGCGGGPDDQKLIEDLLVQGYTTDEPAEECDGALSGGLLKKTYGSAARCRTVEKDPEENKPTGVQVSDVTVDGDRATASVALEGGDQDGARGPMQLVRQGDDWRIDAFSPELLRSTFEASIKTDRDLPEAVKGCFADDIRSMSDDELVAFAYASIGQRPEGLKRLQTMLASCQPESSNGGRDGSSEGVSFLRRKFEEGIVESLQGSGATEKDIVCIKRELRKRISDDRIVELVGSGDQVPRDVTREAAAALAACGTNP
jgi:hypothetical protein